MYFCLESENNAFCKDVRGAWGGVDIEMNTQPVKKVNSETRLLGDEYSLHKRNECGSFCRGYIPRADLNYNGIYERKESLTQSRRK